MRCWYVSSFVLMALVLQLVLQAALPAEARAEEEPGFTNPKPLGMDVAPTPSVQGGETFAHALIEPDELAADAGSGSAAAEGAPAGAPAVATPLARFGLFMTGNASGSGEDEPLAPKAEPGYGRWRSLYQSIEELPEEQKQKASAIVTDSLPRLHEIDTKISGTVGELRALTYSDNADPEALPRLGLDLQRLREELKATLAAVNIRLQKEAGLRLSEPAGRGCESMRVYPAGAIQSVDLSQ